LPERCWAWIKAVEADKRPYRYLLPDWKKIEAFLKMKLGSV
jgi:hypothetical protein